MAKIVKTLTVSWQWSGDKYSLRGFNLAVTPAAKNPKEEVVATAFVETKEIKQTYSYKMGNVTLDKDAQYKIWVQAVYENSDSDWVATGGATVSDDGSATIITKTDREIQDVVNMASDNILTRQEKISLRREWQEIVYEFLEIESTAISQGIPSSNTAFSNFKSKGNALGTYLNGGTTWTISSNNKTSFPLWINDSNLGSNTSINGNTYRETFRVYYEAKVKILEEINKYKVNNIQVGGTNLAIGTNQGSSRWGWALQEGDRTISSEVIDGINCVKLQKGTTTPHSGWNYVSYSKFARDKITPNTTYTVSFEIKSNKTFDVGDIDLKYGDSTNTLIASSKAVAKSVKANSDWTKIIFELKTKDVLPTTTGQVIYITGISATNGNIHYIRNLQLEKGNKATDWSPAVEDLENAYTIVLTNEAQVIPTNNSRVPTSSTTYYTDIVVYQGTTQRTDYTIGTVNSANGITVSKTSSRVNFAVSTNTALTADGGNFIIPITIDGKTFNKTFSWSCSKQGNTGDSGIGISKITEYYAISSSNTTEPTSWSTTVPAMTATNKYLWNYETITYSNNTTTNTSKRVIGVYGDKGNTGATGATGNGISQIVNYYLATSSSSGVTTSTSGWTETIQDISTSKKYLWNYEKITYTDNTTYSTPPTIIGVYGDKGIDAVNLSVWAPNGNIINNNNKTSIELQALMYSGTTDISTSTNTSFKWVATNPNGSETVLQAAKTGANGGWKCIVKADSIPTMLAVRCEATYANKTYKDHIVLEDKIDPIQAVVISTGGDTFKNGTGETYIYAKLIRNGEEIDPITLYDNIPGTTGHKANDIIYIKSSKSYKKLVNNAWANASASDLQFAYSWTKFNQNGVHDTSYSATGKVIHVTSGNVVEKANFVLAVSDK